MALNLNLITCRSQIASAENFAYPDAKHPKEEVLTKLLITMQQKLLDLTPANVQKLLYVDVISVARKYQGHGLAKQLLENMTEHAKKMGCCGGGGAIVIWLQRIQLLGKL